MKLRVEVTPSGAGWLMLGDAVLADFEDPALARAFLAMARAARPRRSRVPDSEPPVCGRCGDEYMLDDGKDPSPECHPCAQETLAGIRRALARLDRVSGERKGGK